MVATESCRLPETCDLLLLFQHLSITSGGADACDDSTLPTQSPVHVRSGYCPSQETVVMLAYVLQADLRQTYRYYTHPTKCCFTFSLNQL